MSGQELPGEYLYIRFFYGCYRDPGGIQGQCKAYVGKLFEISLSSVEEHKQRKLKKLIEHLAKAERLGSLVLLRE